MENFEGTNNREKVWGKFPDTLWGTLFSICFSNLGNSIFPNLGKISLSEFIEKLKGFPDPEIYQISAREIQSDACFCGKVTFRIEKSNPMNICCEK